MEPYKKTVDAWLRADLEAPRKQRHTVRRIVARIEEEFGEAIPYPTVRDLVAARRKEIAAQAGAPVEAFVTRHNALGADAEVDFGDVYVDLAGQRTRCYLFAFRLAYSGKAVHRISRSCGQQEFFEGHVHALTTTETSKTKYALRAGVEGTINQALDITGIRQARYRGLPKVRLQHAFSATALNVIRLDAYWTGHDRHHTRSRLKRLAYRLTA